MKLQWPNINAQGLYFTAKWISLNNVECSFEPFVDSVYTHVHCKNLNNKRDVCDYSISNDLIPQFKTWLRQEKIHRLSDEN